MGKAINGTAIAIGRNIGRAMREKGMTMRGIGRESGVPSSTVCRIVNGATEPTAYTLWRLAKCLGTTMDGLMEGCDG